MLDARSDQHLNLCDIVRTAFSRFSISISFISLSRPLLSLFSLYNLVSTRLTMPPLCLPLLCRP
ncbi:hypothetical protein CY34DRAFT_656004 [Suillus luteus UH-Slu-Lm8-n1]|uniref:Uncharacterized protein n=1 Tax=Suillus luteus UH-Slu-Lm8-n1 TaxID=930992 RepID=A0A0D0A7N6_9AGAM|nr:hypothetical protein CY34DRAFT_656004 [Suillus luteus UH-Slu-Lm8-n1]